MTTTTVCTPSKHIDLPCINKVEWWQPMIWLKQGWGDFKVNWYASLAIGSVFALLGYVFTHIGWSHRHLVATLITGFLLVSPFLAIGFYELSRRREQAANKAASPRENLVSIGLFALLLMFIFSVWERVSAVVVGLYLGPSPVPDASLSWLFSSENWIFVVMLVAVGVLFAAVTFALSVVSLPMLMDRRVDVVTAIVSSVHVVRLNLPAMLVWAAAIVVLTIIGMAPAFIGLAVIFPILGHASWHAYRELVQSEPGSGN